MNRREAIMYMMEGKIVTRGNGFNYKFSEPLGLFVRINVSNCNSEQFDINDLCGENIYGIPEPKTRPMTAYEIAMLPRGTAFVRVNHSTYNPRIYCLPSTGEMQIDGSDLSNYSGYILPTETELRKFEI